MCRADKDKQQLVIEIDSVTTALDSANKAKVRPLASVRTAYFQFYFFSKTACLLQVLQELSYRKQIARQLRTQYVEGIHTSKYYTMTLKSRLRVTQGHWKRNHWTDHTRLTISRVS